MQKNIQLAIPQPCNENWAQMPRDQQGRFCNACATTVVDFTSMSDEALLNFFRNKKSGEYCGRVLNIQIDRNLVIAESRKIPFAYAVLLFLILFIFSKQNTVKAQARLAPDIYAVPFKGTNGTIKNITHLSGTISSRAISGKVLDANGKAIAGAVVNQVNSSDHFITKENGSFVFLINDNVKQIEVTAPGFQPKLITLNEKEHFEITLKSAKQICPPRPEIMGKIVIRNTVN